MFRKNMALMLCVILVMQMFMNVAFASAETELVDEEILIEEVLEDDSTVEEVLEDDSMTEEVLEDDSTVEEVLEDDSTAEEVLEDDSMTEEVLEDDSMTEEVLEDDSMTEEVLEDDSTSEEVLKDDSTTEEVLEDDSTAEEVLEDDSTAEEVLVEEPVLEIVSIEEMASQEETTEDAYSYTLTSDDVVFSNGEIKEIKDYSFVSKGQDGVLIIIPEKIDGESVVGIGDDFLLNQSIERIELPEGLEFIGKSAFKGNFLTELKIPNTVRFIEEGAFMDCEIEELIFSESLISIGKDTFRGNKISDLTIPDNITCIEDNAFMDCNIENLTLPESIMVVKEKAFAGNPLSNITILGTPTSIDGGAFMNSNTVVLTMPVGFTGNINDDIFNSDQSILHEVNIIGNSNHSYVDSEMSYEVYREITKNHDYDPPLYFETGEKFTEGMVLKEGDTLYKDVDTIKAEYTVIFLDHNGDIVKTEMVSEGNNATPPTMDKVTLDGPKGGFIHFWGWIQDYTNVQDDLTVSPDYTLFYTVRFLDSDVDGNPINTQIIESGMDAEPPSESVLLPKPGYTFIGWDKDYTNIQSDLTITPVYRPDVIETVEYTVTFLDHDGNIIKTEIVEEGSDATAPTMENISLDGPKGGYLQFRGWLQTYTNVQSNLVVSPDYSLFYTVKFFNVDGSILKDELVSAGTDVEPPSESVLSPKPGYTFIGWDKDSTNVQSDLNIKPIYQADVIEIAEYTVKFLDHNGDVIKTEIVEEGSDATPPAMENITLDGPKGGYLQFLGWSQNYTNIQGDLVVSSDYSLFYTVKFIDVDGSILKEDSVSPGMDAEPPLKSVLSPKPGYTFTGWDKEYTDVQSDLSIKAQYKKEDTDSSGGDGSSEGGNSSNTNRKSSDDKDRPSEPAKEQLNLNSRSFMLGMPDGSFQPEKNLTRAEMVVLLDRFYRLEDTYHVIEPSIDFLDVDKSMWYYDALNRVVQKGFVIGYGNGYFGPEDPISREELAQIIYNKFELASYYSREIDPNYVKKIYNDFEKTWSLDALMSLQYRGILQDFQGDLFEPHKAITRGETVLMLNRYFGYSVAYDMGFDSKFKDIGENHALNTAIALASTDQLIMSDFIEDLENDKMMTIVVKEK